MKRNKKAFRKKIEVLIGIVSILVVALIVNFINYSITFRVKYNSPKSGNTQIYWDYGEGLSEEQSKMVKNDNGITEIPFTRKEIKKLECIRVDFPVNNKSVCNLRSVSISVYGFDFYEYTGREIYRRNVFKRDVKQSDSDGNNMKMKVSGPDPSFSVRSNFLKDIKKDIRHLVLGINIAWGVILYSFVRILTGVLWKYRKEIHDYLVRCSFDKMKPRYVAGFAFSILFLIAGYIAFFLCRFLVKQFNGISFAEVIFHLKVPMEGTGGSMIEEGVDFVKIPMRVGAVILVILLVVLACVKKIRNNKFTIRVLGMVTAVLWIVTISQGVHDLGVVEYIQLYMKKSAFIEENYIETAQTELHFPEKKRNLIYIYLESMESTFISQEEGGTMENNLIPELTALADNNINFSEDDLVGGAHSTTGTTWTVGAMVAQTGGMPLLLPINGNNYDSYGEFLPGITTLGDILKTEGYNQEIMVGSDLKFGGRKIYFKQHGEYQVWDYHTAVDQGKIDDDYYVWWGYEDKKLFSYAKEEILRLAKEDKPFNFTMLTADTHHIGGYKCDLCEEEWDDQYENVLSCSSRQVASFVSWLKAQDFFDDTTIVIAGDHPTMDNEYISEHYNDSKPRRVYNCIINSAVESENTKNRKFTTMDLFPTTLAAMGVDIDGERLALGTNLFSSEKTLAEQYGYETIDTELKKMSKFYDRNILNE